MVVKGQAGRNAGIERLDSFGWNRYFLKIGMIGKTCTLFANEQVTRLWPLEFRKFFPFHVEAYELGVLEAGKLFARWALE